MAADAAHCHVGPVRLRIECAQFPCFVRRGGIAPAVRHVVSFFFSAAPRLPPIPGAVGTNQDNTDDRRLPKRASGARTGRRASRMGQGSHATRSPGRCHRRAPVSRGGGPGLRNPTGLNRARLPHVRVFAYRTAEKNPPPHPGPLRPQGRRGSKDRRGLRSPSALWGEGDRGRWERSGRKDSTLKRGAERLRRRDLLGGHQARNRIEDELHVRALLLGGAEKPGVGAHEVARHVDALDV